MHKWRNKANESKQLKSAIIITGTGLDLQKGLIVGVPPHEVVTVKQIYTHELGPSTLQQKNH